jgi:hypothetical protein
LHYFGKAKLQRPTGCDINAAPNQRLGMAMLTWRETTCALAVVAALPFVIASSCSTLDDQPGTIKVEAPESKCWSGAIGDSTKDGCGSKSFDIEGESIIVGNAQKQSPSGWTLTLTLEIDGEVVDTSTTSAEFGIAQVAEK